MTTSTKCEHCGADDGFEHATDADTGDGDSDDCAACGFPSNFEVCGDGSWTWVPSVFEDAFCDDNACAPCRAVVAKLDDVLGEPVRVVEAVHRSDAVGLAGDRCEGGSNCGRTGCPECQQ